MFFAIIVVPVAAYYSGGGIDGISTAMEAKDISLNIFKYTKVWSLPIIISGLGWGLGYFGQPHIIVRFMSIDSADELWKSRLIAMIWVFISLLGAILSAIMSTISSQLLVSSNTLTEDFYKHIVKREKTHKEMIWVGRLCVIVIFVIASVLAMNPSSKVLELVSYAWAGFGGVFSPVILFTLYKKDLHWKTVLVSMIIATITVITWKTSGLSNILYEMVPAFVINSISIYLLEKFKVFGNNEK